MGAEHIDNGRTLHRHIISILPKANTSAGQNFVCDLESYPYLTPFVRTDNQAEAC